MLLRAAQTGANAETSAQTGANAQESEEVMPHNSHDYFLVIDLEATCDDTKKIIPKEEMEIIEIGAVLVSAYNQRPVSAMADGGPTFGEFDIFVKPVRHPQLTDFCKSLTGITQEQVDHGVSFMKAIDALRTWVGRTVDRDLQRVLFCSWGFYDKNQFALDCDYHEVPYPFGVHLNLKQQLAHNLHLENTKGLGVSNALHRLSMKFEGSPHRGIDDARNIARLLPFALPPELRPETLTVQK